MVGEWESIPVLIIGGGVVGLSASLFLAQHDIRSIVIERHSGTSIHPRARSVNARTMELYRTIGIADHVREAGKSISASTGMFLGQTLARSGLQSSEKFASHTVFQDEKQIVGRLKRMKERDDERVIRSGQDLLFGQSAFNLVAFNHFFFGKDYCLRVSITTPSW